MRRLMAAEAAAMNRILDAQHIRARVTLHGALAVRSSFVGYPLRLADGERLARVVAVERELGHAVYQVRRRLVAGYDAATAVRLREYPLAVELPFPNPQPLPAGGLDLTDRALRALVGRSYQYGQAPEPEYIDLENDPHVLFAAISGGGKSTVMRMALASLLHNTAPADLRVALVDLKNADFPPFADLPHVLAFAGDPPAAAAVVAQVLAELQQRIASRQMPYRVLLLVDELAQLRGDKQAMQALESIMNMGRALGVHVWAGTQYPSRETITSGINTAFTTRIVGRVDSKVSALVAAKRPGTGAEALLVPGDFLRVAGDVRRLKAYNLTMAETAERIQAIAQRWGGRPAAVALPEPAATPDRLAEVVALVRPVVERGGSQNDMVRAVFGPGANTGGSNLVWIKRARAVLEQQQPASDTRIWM